MRLGDHTERNRPGHVILVTGGARSGKSHYAETRVRELAPASPWLYVATAEPLDDEMRERIAAHREKRGEGWVTSEAPLDPAEALKTQARRLSARAAILDCVTLWLSNRLLRGDTDLQILDAADALGAAAQHAGFPVVLVTNEVGLGIVPDRPLGRRFRDLAGLVNQRLAARADEVVLVACGLPLRLR